MRTTTAVLLAAALLAARIRADYAYIECANPLIVTGLLTGLINIIVTAGSAADSYTGCPTYCQGVQGTTYSLYQPGLFGILSNCYCTDQQPTSQFAASGSDSSGNCGIGTYHVNYLGPVADILDFTGCTTGGSAAAGSPAAFQTPNADACFNACQSFKYLIMTPASIGNAFTCQCAHTLNAGSSTTCRPNVQNIYNNPAIIPSGNGQVQRKRLAMKKRLEENNSPCLGGEEACLIPGSDHAWECVDTNLDLESCGGCVVGVFDQPQRNATGVDCTIGAAVGGASCTRGVCKQWRCAYGWVLEGDRCVRKFGTNEGRRRR